MSDAAKILVVEDDRDHARALTIRLRAQGYQVRVAQDAYRATHAVRQELPDLVILDYRLPAGDGLRVHERLRDISQGSVPIIYLTGDGSREVEEQARAFGAAAVFRKPADFERLLNSVQECLSAVPGHTIAV